MMTLRLLIVKDDTILYEAPLTPEAYDIEHVVEEIVGGELWFLNALSSLFSNMRRLQIMSELLKSYEEELEFSELILRLRLNPKQVWEHVKALERSGLIERRGWGRYAVSKLGLATMLLTCSGFPRLLKLLEEMLG